MAKTGPKTILTAAILKDQIRIENELTKIITKIVDALVAEECGLKKDLEGSDYAFLDDSLSKFAWQAELKLQIEHTKKIKKSVMAILKSSTNKMVLATIEIKERVN